jgi:DNA helicase HerA-like ATPase
MSELSSSLSTPTDRQAALTVGTVESVSPAKVTVALELDAPRTTALNTGSPVAFPRLNGFVVIPNESGALVGIVTWLGIEHSTFPKRPGMKDFGLVDLPFPLRKMTVVPVGTLERAAVADTGSFRLKRGVVVFPSIGDPVALPSASQLKALTQGEVQDERVAIGRSLLGNDAEVRVDPDKLFGRHLAVLGNTGSGKSCTVAGLIRWSLEAAQRERGKKRKSGKPNARFIVLDPSGEYRQAFDDIPGFQLFQVPPVEADNAKDLRVPAWLLNSHEWSSATSASAKVQRPVLFDGLRNLRTGNPAEVGVEYRLSRLCKGQLAFVEAIKLTPARYTAFPQMKGFGKALEAIKEGLEAYDGIEVGAEELRALIGQIDGVLSDRAGYRRGDYEAFSEPDLDSIIESYRELIDALPATSDIPMGNEDLPLEFDADLLADHLDVVASLNEYDEAPRYIGGLKLRIRSLLNDERMRPILMPGESPLLEEWLEEFLGSGEGTTVAVIDLSLVPSDVVELVVAVMGRMIFEALQRHRRIHRQALPTALILEEAHTFVRHHPPGDEFQSPGEMCVRAFERIAREGRKFGLGLILASQRPSELSPTILAQCNSFLLHRLVNDRDQQLVGKLVPDNLAGMLEDLPSLPTRHALLLGWAAVLPTLLEIRELPERERPQSADPDFWDVWVGKEDRKATWGKVVRDWIEPGASD